MAIKIVVLNIIKVNKYDCVFMFKNKLKSYLKIFKKYILSILKQYFLSSKYNLFKKMTTKYNYFYFQMLNMLNSLFQ